MDPWDYDSQLPEEFLFGNNPPPPELDDSPTHMSSLESIFSHPPFQDASWNTNSFASAASELVTAQQPETVFTAVFPGQINTQAADIKKEWSAPTEDQHDDGMIRSITQELSNEAKIVDQGVPGAAETFAPPFEGSNFYAGAIQKESLPIPEPDSQPKLPNRRITINAIIKSGSQHPITDSLPVTIHDEDDDDIMIVNEQDCSSSARRKWAIDGKRKVRVEDKDDLIYIKSEKVDVEELPRPVKQRPKNGSQLLFARQREMLRRHQAQRQVANGTAIAGPSYSSSLFGAVNPGVQESAQAQQRTKIRAHDPSDFIIIDDIVNEKEEFASLMRHEDDDHSWMHADGPSGSDNEELHNLRSLNASLERRRERKLDFTQADRHELQRINGKLELQEQRKNLAERRMGIGAEARIENPMFVSEEYEEIPNDYGTWGDLGSDADNQFDDDEHLIRQKDIDNVNDERLARAIQEDDFYRGPADAEGGSGSRTKEKKGGSRRKFAKNAREIEDRRREKELEKERKKRNRGGGGGRVARPTSIRGKGGRNSSNSSKKSKSGAKASASTPRSRMRNRWHNNEDLTLQAVVEDLLHNDFIADRANQEDYGIAPNIKERSNKERQLDALLASVPEDYDVHKLRVQKADIRRASKRFGFGQVKAEEGKWKLKGMKSSLYHHQLLAADWMVSRELGTRPPHGGLLADAMGLGKTLETLATMVGNPPSNALLKRGIKTTLLVLPCSAIKQWRDEIVVHCEERMFPKVLHWKASKDIPLNALGDFDIVLTSYAEVMASYPFPTEEDMKSFLKEGGFEKWLKQCKDSAGDLHKHEWYRVVLDEAHAIKNHRSRTSIACQNLKGKYRWALSGTPIQNRLEELFPYFRFLQAPWTNKFDDFKKHFCDVNADDANARMSVILSIVMMRRTMKDKMLGRPIVELPEIHAETKFISFSREEQVFYRVLEDRFRDNMNRHFARGTAQKNYATFMVQLLRLRQCTAHPFLLESTVKQVLNLEDLRRLRHELKSLQNNKKPIYEQIEQWVQESEEDGQEARDGGEAAIEPVPFGRSDFGKYFQMTKFLDTLNAEDLMQRVVCRLCLDLPTNAQITDCNHIFCEDCLRNHIHKSAVENEDSDYSECPSCQRIFTEAKPYKDLNLRDDQDEVGDNSSSQETRTRKKRKGKEIQNPDPFTGDSTWLRLCIQDPKKYVLPSAKTIAFKAQILKWLQENADDKIIVFVQFRMMAKIIGLICEAEEWEHVYFTGNMNTIQRHDAVRRFHTDPNIKIMIAGLKVGGQALNLTCANRVISTSLWFNHCVEQQAFGRVFRIGQHKPTYVSRFVVKNTVDCRILDMQADKVKNIDRAMQDTGNKVEPLSMTDLASLFGHLRKDENGIMRIEADYEEAEDEDQAEDES